MTSTWIYDDVKVEFSEPSIQAWESVVHVESTKGILYYYYTMTVCRKNDKKKWKKEFVSYVWDSPSLLCINEKPEKIAKKIIKKQEKNVRLKNPQKKYRDNGFSAYCMQKNK